MELRPSVSDWTSPRLAPSALRSLTLCSLSKRSQREAHCYVTDDLGYNHYAVPACYWATPDHEGFGDRWLRPPLDARARRLRFTLSTPWEAPWAEVELH
jgi:hypothetical protein